MPKLPSGLHRVSITTEEINFLHDHHNKSITDLESAIADTKNSPVVTTALECSKAALQKRVEVIAGFLAPTPRVGRPRKKVETKPEPPKEKEEFT